MNERKPINYSRNGKRYRLFRCGLLAGVDGKEYTDLFLSEADAEDVAAVLADHPELVKGRQGEGDEET